MTISWPKGSKWRKWDLHVHSPASHNYAGDWNQFIIQLGNADCDVVGINDYFSIAGYREVQRRLNDPSAGAEGNKPYREALLRLKLKTLIPVVECRMNNVVLDKKGKSGPRINFHLIFDPKLDPDNIETFIKGLKVKGTSIGGRYADAKFLLEEVSVNFGETCHALSDDGTFKEKFLIWIPYDEYGGIDGIKAVQTRAEMEEAVSTYAARAAEKMRRQKLAAPSLMVFLETNSFRPHDAQYHPSQTVTLPVPSADTAKIIRAALSGLAVIWREGYRYKKAGVMLLDLLPAATVQAALFDRPDDARSQTRMRTMDSRARLQP